MPRGLTLIIGGAIGNVIDRIVHGYVVDFLDFHLRGWHFPAFNVADCAITVGADYLITEDHHFDPLADAGYKPQPINPDEFIRRHLSGK